MRVKYMKMIHRKCRHGYYPSSSVKRFDVRDEKVGWNVEFPEYAPVVHNSNAIRNKPWADPEIGEASFKPKWNSLDGKVNRESFMGNYAVTKNGYPLNPIGRTGIIGRGLLGRWGPNHAADPIVTRWKRNNANALEIDQKTQKPVLQFVAIERCDSGEWAIPGGMVDPGEIVSVTLKREFMEEAMNCLEKSKSEKEELEKQLSAFLAKGDEIYKGYVDDPRNTDNAWIETMALNFHDESGSIIGCLSLQAGDDAKNVKWMDVGQNLNLYASHNEFLKRTAQKHGAHW